MIKFLTITPEAARRFYGGKKFHRNLSREQIDKIVAEVVKIFSQKYPRLEIFHFRRCSS